MANLRVGCATTEMQCTNVRSVNQNRAVALKLLIFALASVPLPSLCNEAARTTIPLAGQWRFALDPTDVGIAQGWFNSNLTHRIRLPGILQAQGYGNEINTNTPWVLTLYDTNWFLRDDYKAYIKPGNVKVPFICQPPRHYLGPAWYQRQIEIPRTWRGRRVVVSLERVNWESRLWLNDRLIGTNNSLCTPHEFDLGILPPGKYRLTIRVDNRMQLPYRPDAHSVSDSLGQSWNGIVGKIELRATPAVWIENVHAVANVQTRSVLLKVQLGNVTGAPGKGVLEVLYNRPASRRLTVRTRSPERLIKAPVEWGADGGTTEIEVTLPKDKNELWDEFTPALHSLQLVFAAETGTQTVNLPIGLRELKAVGQDLVINGRPTHLRGTHHGGDFPLTGYPACDVEYWRKLFATCKKWGLNHVRFHSFCPPEAAFAAADELGIYLQIEPGMWNTFNPGTPMEEMLYFETARIIKYYGNHPSFVLFSPSNEPKGRWRDVLPKWAAYFRASDPRRLYTTGTGFTDPDAPGPLDKVDFCVTQRFGQRRVRGEPGWFGRGYSNALHNVTVPVIVHELGQWCAYPDFDVIKKFTGHLRPGNYEIFRDSAAASGLLSINKQFARASGRFQLACYKEEIEANLLTPGLAGFQLLDLHDYIGQGTALVGVLDPFWEEKSYVTAHEWRRFCNVTVPLVRLTKRVFTTAEKLEADVEVAHYDTAPLTNSIVSWQVTDTRGKTVAQGEFQPRTISIGRNTAIGKIELDLGTLRAASMYKLIVRVLNAGGARAGYGSHTEPTIKNELAPVRKSMNTASVGLGNANNSSTEGGQACESGSAVASAQLVAENDWNFWLYPARVDESEPPDVFVTCSWDEAEAKLAAGSKVLFVPRPAELDWCSPPLAEVPIFWNRLMNPQWSRMLGLWCDTNHPALAKFPTADHCDWHWTELSRNARAINIGQLPRNLEPIVAAIDDWNRNWRLAPIFEAKVGRGKLLVCSFDIVNDLQARPVARQLRRSLLDYMASAKFAPAVQLRPEQIRSLLFDTLVMRKLGARASGPGTNPNATIDGDPNTFWTTTDPVPWLTISFTQPVAINGVVLMSRQNDRNHAGDIRAYKIEVSNDGQLWHKIACGELGSTWLPQSVRFQQTVTAQYLKLTRLSGFGEDKSTALAELAVMYAGPKLTDTGTDKLEYKRIRSGTPDIDEAQPSGTTPQN